MEVVRMHNSRYDEWNEFVNKEPSCALLQSWEWGSFKENMGWKAYRVGVKKQGKIVAGAQMLIKSFPLGLTSIAYVPRGPIGYWLEEGVTQPLLDELHRIAQQHKAAFLKIEPPLPNDPGTSRRLEQQNFRTSHYTNQPRATIILDLKPSLKVVLNNIDRKTRYSIKYGAKKGVTVRLGTQADLPDFYRLMQITSRRGRFPSRFLGYYQNEWQTFAENKQVALLVAEYDGETLAARMAFRFGRHAADIHAASSNGHRNLRANHLLVWEAVKWAKTHGCQTYDLWGIPSEICQTARKDQEPLTPDRTDGFWGVYQFKRSFGRNITCYVGAYDYVYSPLIYPFFINNILNTGVLDRIATRMDA